MKISYMDSVSGSNMRTVEVQKIIESIKIGTWKEKIEQIRYYISIGDDKKATELKRGLPGFTISASFQKRRKEEYIEYYSGLLHLDYDKLDDVEELKAKVVKDPCTYAAFISPSGNGLKVLVKSNNNLSTHTHAFNALKERYDAMVGVESDRSVKDVTRLCFISYDPDLYFNENSEVFNFNSSINDQVTTQKDLDWVWDFTSKKMEFIEGNRNSFIYLFACNANRQGNDINEVISYAFSYSDSTFNKEEIEQTVKSAYTNNVDEKRGVAKPAISAISSPKVESSPFIPEHVFDALPNTLKEACNVFKGRERDVFLTAALSVTSGGLHNVYGLYSNEKVYSNLYSFIIAPPASGKGTMKYAKQLGDCYHEFLFHQRMEEIEVYKREKRSFDLKLKKAKSDKDIEALVEPEKPKLKMFFIPGDTSSAMIVKHLKDNDGMGCICETEADTLTNALKQDWGGFSDILRKGFQAEVITKSRITNLEYSEIKEPKFSVTITGTPNQLGSLITSVQDGLFSRFLFYSFISNPVWKKTYTSAVSRSNKEIFEHYSAELCDKFKSDVTQKFIMTEEQGRKLDSIFSEALGHNAALYNEDVNGVVFRLGLMSFKIAMVLSAIRSDDAEVICSDEDFNTAMCLVKEVYMNHSINLLNRLNKNPGILNTNQTTLLTWIKTQDSFKRSEIAEISLPLGIKDRTLTSILMRFIDLNLIKKMSHGVYAKT